MDLEARLDVNSGTSGEFQRFWISPNPNAWGLNDKITYPRCSNASCSATVTGGQLLNTDWSNGRIKKVNNWTNDLTYHPSGSWSTIPHTNGTSDAHVVQTNNNARTQSLNTTNPGNLWNTGAYSYDGSGNIITIGDTSAQKDIYHYDKVNRLARAWVRDAAAASTRQDYTYDVFGNMTEVKTWPVGGGTQTTTIAVNANTNRLSVASYDASGNMTSWGANGYEYDTGNNMTVQDDRWFFLYNFSGERVATIDWQGSIATREVDWTIRGPGNQVLSTFKLTGEDQSGNWSHEMDYIWMGRRLLGTQDGSGTKQHYHTDHLGSIRLVTDDLGNKVSEHEYLPYGQELTAAGNGIMKFTGHERDSDTSMDYMHARFYTSHLGRFMGVDPVQRGDEIWNAYSYVGGNPIGGMDPDGRQRAGWHATFFNNISGGLSSGVLMAGFSDLIIVTALSPDTIMAIATEVMLERFLFSGTAVGITGASVERGPLETGVEDLVDHVKDTAKEIAEGVAEEVVKFYCNNSVEFAGAASGGLSKGGAFEGTLGTRGLSGRSTEGDGWGVAAGVGFQYTRGPSLGSDQTTTIYTFGPVGYTSSVDNVSGQKNSSVSVMYGPPSASWVNGQSTSGSIGDPCAGGG